MPKYRRGSGSVYLKRGWCYIKRASRTWDSPSRSVAYAPLVRKLGGEGATCG